MGEDRIDLHITRSMKAFTDFLRGKEASDHAPALACAELMRLPPPKRSYIGLLPADIRDRVDLLICPGAWRSGTCMMRTVELPLEALVHKCVRITLSDGREMLAYTPRSPPDVTVLAFVKELDDHAKHRSVRGEVGYVLAQRHADGSPLILTREGHGNGAHVPPVCRVVSVLTGAVVGEVVGRDFSYEYSEYSTSRSMLHNEQCSWLDLGDHLRRLPALTESLPLPSVLAMDTARPRRRAECLAVCGAEGNERIVSELRSKEQREIKVWDMRQQTLLSTWHHRREGVSTRNVVFADLGVIVFSPTPDKTIVHYIATGVQRTIPTLARRSQAVPWDRSLYLSGRSSTLMKDFVLRLDVDSDTLIQDLVPPGSFELTGPHPLLRSGAEVTDLVSGKRAKVESSEHLCVHSDCVFHAGNEKAFMGAMITKVYAILFDDPKSQPRLLLERKRPKVNAAAPSTYVNFLEPSLPNAQQGPIVEIDGTIFVLPDA